MKTIIHLELNDEQRNALAVLLDGKQTTRLATRKDVTAFVEAGVAHALEEPPEEPQESPQESPQEDDDWMGDSGTPAQPNNDSYMRGWRQVGDRLRSRK